MDSCDSRNPFCDVFQFLLHPYTEGIVFLEDIARSEREANVFYAKVVSFSLSYNNKHTNKHKQITILNSYDDTVLILDTQENRETLCEESEL